MSKIEINPHYTDLPFLELPRVYENVPATTLAEALSALSKLLDAQNEYESKVEPLLIDIEKSGIQALSLIVKESHEKLLGKAIAQILAEFTLRVYLAGEDGRYFINNYESEHTSLFSGFDTQTVIYMATNWQNQKH